MLGISQWITSSRFQLNGKVETLGSKTFSCEEKVGVIPARSWQENYSLGEHYLFSEWKKSIFSLTYNLNLQSFPKATLSECFWKTAFCILSFQQLTWLGLSIIISFEKLNRCKFRVPREKGETILRTKLKVLSNYLN